MASNPPVIDREKLIGLLQQLHQLTAACLVAAGELAVPGDPVVQPVLAADGGKSAGLDFGLPLRAFVNKYARGMAGPAKFTLVLAHMARGAVGSKVPVTSISKAWNGMTGLLKDFKDAYPTRAKDQGWVDSPEKSVYTLLPGWTAILGGDAK